MPSIKILLATLTFSMPISQKAHSQAMTDPTTKLAWEIRSISCLPAGRDRLARLQLVLKKPPTALRAAFTMLHRDGAFVVGIGGGPGLSYGEYSEEYNGAGRDADLGECRRSIGLPTPDEQDHVLLAAYCLTQGKAWTRTELAQAWKPSKWHPGPNHRLMVAALAAGYEAEPTESLKKAACYIFYNGGDLKKVFWERLGDVRKLRQFEVLSVALHLEGQGVELPLSWQKVAKATIRRRYDGETDIILARVRQGMKQREIREFSRILMNRALALGNRGVRDRAVARALWFLWDENHMWLDKPMEHFKLNEDTARTGRTQSILRALYNMAVHARKVGVNPKIEERIDRNLPRIIHLMSEDTITMILKWKWRRARLTLDDAETSREFFLRASQCGNVWDEWISRKKHWDTEAAHHLLQSLGIPHPKKD